MINPNYASIIKTLEDAIVEQRNFFIYDLHKETETLLKSVSRINALKYCKMILSIDTPSILFELVDRVQAGESFQKVMQELNCLYQR